MEYRQTGKSKYHRALSGFSVCMCYFCDIQHGSKVTCLSTNTCWGLWHPCDPGQDEWHRKCTEGWNIKILSEMHQKQKTTLHQKWDYYLSVLQCPRDIFVFSNLQHKDTVCVWENLSKMVEPIKTWLSLLASNKPGELVKIFSLICSESYSHSDQRDMVGSA